MCEDPYVARRLRRWRAWVLALIVCVAAAEFAILDLLGKLTSKAIGDLVAGVKRREIAVYRASGNRGNTPEQEVAYLKQIVAESGAKALKFRLGGRMSRNADSLPGRTEKLIPMVRDVDLDLRKHENLLKLESMLIERAGDNYEEDE